MTTLQEIKRENALLLELAKKRDRLIIHEFLPRLEKQWKRIEALEQALRDSTQRIELLEQAVADLAAVAYKARTGKDVRNDVRTH